MPGQQGLNAGVLPDPGISYAEMTINYSSNKLNDANGNQIPLVGSYDVFAIENIFYYVPKAKILGGKLALMAAFPTIANGSVTLGSITSPDTTLNAGGFGLADTWFQPVTLGWNFKRVDFYTGYAFMAPTGRYTPGASDNVGSGYWGNNFLTGTTAYLTKNKATTANLTTNWEGHSSKTTGRGTKLTPGEAFTIEWGAGQLIPIKKNLTQILQVGLIGYDQWQVDRNGGFLSPGVSASAVPFYSVHAIGFQTTYLLPAKSLGFFFKYENEYRALARPEGRTIVFGGTYTFRIPKPAPPPAKP